MPLPSTKTMPPRREAKMNGDMDAVSSWCRSSWCCNGAFGKKILMTLVGVLLVYSIFYIGTLIRNNIKEYQTIGQADKMERTIMVGGVGKVTGSNDIAMTSLGYSNVDKDVLTAQKNNKRVMDPILAELRRLGIEDKDLKTTYSIRPEYVTVPDKAPQLSGYRVESGVQIKIRDLNNIAAVVALAGKYGATQVGDLQFTIDDTENLKAEARTKALADAQVKAQQLAASLGVQLRGVVSFYESEGVDYPLMYSSSMMPMKAMSEAVPVMAPSTSPVVSGSKDVTMNVSVTYEIAPLMMRYNRW